MRLSTPASTGAGVSDLSYFQWSSITKGAAMSSSGKIDEMKGRVRSAFGELTDDDEQKQKGSVEKTAGKAKEAVDHAKEKVEKFLDRDRH
jgi:uncharacterized protein YjbJ (UPF0337 family)